MSKYRETKVLCFIIIIIIVFFFSVDLTVHMTKYSLGIFSVKQVVGW